MMGPPEPLELAGSSTTQLLLSLPSRPVPHATVGSHLAAGIVGGGLGFLLCLTVVIVRFNSLAKYLFTRRP